MRALTALLLAGALLPWLLAQPQPGPSPKRAEEREPRKKETAREEPPRPEKPAPPEPKRLPREARAGLEEFRLLRPGRYELVLDGVLCNACTRAVVEALADLREVSEADFDFEEGSLRLVIAPERRLRLARVERALRRASSRADLGTEFRIREIRYSPR